MLGTSGKARAISYFLERGFKKEDLQFDEENNLIVKFIHPGFIIADDGQEIWFNIADLGLFTTGDGTPYPKELLEGIQNDRWEVLYSRLFCTLCVILFLYPPLVLSPTS